MTKMRLFELHRDVDASGVSGVGVVAEGVEMTNGMCAMTWLTPTRCVNVYENIKAVEIIHGHEGRTRIVWIDAGNKLAKAELISTINFPSDSDAEAQAEWIAHEQQCKNLHHNAACMEKNKHEQASR